MTQFKIDITKTKLTEQSFQTAEKNLDAIAEEIKRCKGKMNTVSMNSLKLQLQKLWEQVAEEAASLQSFREALQYVGEQYKEFETKINAGIQNTDPIKINEEQNITSEEALDKRNWWQKLWDFILGRDHEDDYISTTEEQRQAADLDMQKRANALLEEEKYSEEKWSKASVEERKQMLNDYMSELENIMGIDVRGNIDFFYEEPQNGMITNGYYRNFGKRVHLNEYNLSRSSSYNMFYTLMHELRHAYQRAAVKNPTKYKVDKKTLEQWEYNFDHYINSDQGYDAYRNQVIERDARWFAGQA